MQSDYSESNVLVAVARFVDDVLNGSVFNLNVFEFIQCIRQLNSALQAVHNPHDMYSAKIIAFIDAYNQCEAVYQCQCDELLVEHFCDIIHSFTDSVSSEFYINAIQEHKNKTSLTSYVSHLTQHYNRLLFVRVDLSYLLNQQHLVTIANMQQDLAKLLKMITNQRHCFNNLQGYAWALEQGIDKGYHCHLLLMFDGSKHQNDWYFGKQVGELWKNITNEQGTFFSCNDPKYKQGYKERGKLGIGMIHRHNELEVQNAIDTANYLVNPEKSDQFLRVRTSKHMKTFGIGVFNSKARRGVQRTLNTVLA